MRTERRPEKYHDHSTLPFLVSLYLARQPAKNTMKYTIDDADYIINLTKLILANQHLTNTRHSHSIINKPFFFFLYSMAYFPAKR